MFKTKIIEAVKLAAPDIKDPEILHQIADAVIEIIVQARIDAAIRIHKEEEQG